MEGDDASATQALWNICRYLPMLWHAFLSLICIPLLYCLDLKPAECWLQSWHSLEQSFCCQLRLFWLLGYLTYLDLCRVSLARLSAHVLALHAAGKSSDRFRSHQRVHYLLSEMCFEVSDTARDQCLLHIWCLLTYIGESVRSTTNNDTIVYLRQHELTQHQVIGSCVPAVRGLSHSEMIAMSVDTLPCAFHIISHMGSTHSGDSPG